MCEKADWKILINFSIFAKKNSKKIFLYKKDCLKYSQKNLGKIGKKFYQKLYKKMSNFFNFLKVFFLHKT